MVQIISLHTVSTVLILAAFLDLVFVSFFFSFVFFDKKKNFYLFIYLFNLWKSMTFLLVLVKAVPSVLICIIPLSLHFFLFKILV